MRIVLVGYRGAGKSTVGHLLAESLQLDYISTDGLIEQKISATIMDYVNENGWNAFRKIESAVLAEALALENAVIDTGGGVVEDAANRKLLKDTGNVFYLEAGVAALTDRLSEDQVRPALTGGTVLSEIEDVLARRDPLYRSVADHIVDASKPTGEVLDQILTLAHDR